MTIAREGMNVNDIGKGQLWVRLMRSVRPRSRAVFLVIHVISKAIIIYESKVQVLDSIYSFICSNQVSDTYVSKEAEETDEKDTRICSVQQMHIKVHVTRTQKRTQLNEHKIRN